MADYGCYPLWHSDPCFNLDPRTLPISGSLVDALNRWAAVYDSTLVADDPVRSGFATPLAGQEFGLAGRKLAEWLRCELPGHYHVCYIEDGAGQNIKHTNKT